eukprot:30812-Pelagococcus_subviridis.AAC.5
MVERADSAVLAVHALDVVPASDLVQGAAGEELELEVDERGLVLARLPLARRVLRLSGFFPPHVRANLREVRRYVDRVQGVRGDELEDALLHGRSRFRVELLLVEVSVRGA